MALDQTAAPGRGDALGRRGERGNLPTPPRLQRDVHIDTRFGQCLDQAAVKKLAGAPIGLLRCANTVS